MNSTHPIAIEKKPFHIAVIGGGIGGLALAIGLIRRGVSVTIYEAAAAFSEIGAGVGFGPNTQEAMRLIDPGIYAGFERQKTGNGHADLEGNWYNFRFGISGPNSKEGYDFVRVKTGKDGDDLRTQGNVHRAYFLDELIQLVPKGTAEFGKRLVNLEQREDKVYLQFLDGSTAEADAVVGCDGVKSRTRQILLGKDHPATEQVFSGKYAFRGLVPMDKAVEGMGDRLARNRHMWLGHHGHVLHFPVEHGTTVTIVAYRDKENGKWENASWVVPASNEEILREFSGWDKSLMALLSLMEDTDKWAIFYHDHAPTYYNKRLCILGDAAHASTPHQGAGAGQALEDAFVLSNLLGKVKNVNELEHAFRAYDNVRRPRSQQVVSQSLYMGRLFDLEVDSLGDDPIKLAEEIQNLPRWIWDINLEAHLKEAFDAFDKAKIASTT